MRAFEMLKINKLRSFPTSAPTRSLDIIFNFSFASFDPYQTSPRHLPLQCLPVALKR